MKILFITSSSINGGAQKHIKEMFLSLTRMGHTVNLAAPQGWLTNELKDFPENIIIIDSSWRNIQKMSSVINAFRPDITNTFILSGGCFGVAAWKKKKYGKIFVTVNNPVIYDGISCINRIIYPLLYKWMAKYASAFLVKSDKVRDEVRGVIRNRCKVLSIKNGIDFQCFDKDGAYSDLRETLGFSQDDIILTNVAALEERKGQKYLLDAIAKLKDKYPIQTLIVGEGSIREDLEKQIEEKDLKDNVFLLGARKDINSILYNSDIFVLSSIHEGLPNALMEAMAMGKPCVATDVGGVRQLITNEREGLVVDSKDSEGICKAVEKIINNAEYAEEIKNNAYQKMKNEFDQSAVTQELLKIYTTDDSL